jgi:putative ABC transport system ATP-binding protein
MIEMKNITKTYQMGEIQVRALMNLLGCLDSPTEGRYSLDGRDVSGLSEKELAHIRNQQMGFVFQGYNLLARTRAVQQVELPLMYAGVVRAERRRLAQKALEAVGLGERLQHKPEELSGGQQQRVAIARALVTQPSIILADEPTGNVDSRTGHGILRTFQKLNDQGITVVFVTHDAEVAEYGRRIIRLRDGLIEQDTPVH